LIDLLTEYPLEIKEKTKHYERFEADAVGYIEPPDLKEFTLIFSCVHKRIWYNSSQRILLCNMKGTLSATQYTSTMAFMTAYAMVANGLRKTCHACPHATRVDTRDLILPN
jgi:hypothetical protein